MPYDFTSCTPHQVSITFLFVALLLFAPKGGKWYPWCLYILHTYACPPNHNMRKAHLSRLILILLSSGVHGQVLKSCIVHLFLYHYHHLSRVINLIFFLFGSEVIHYRSIPDSFLMNYSVQNRSEIVLHNWFELYIATSAFGLTFTPFTV
jgi:hypothetical protein